MSVPNELEKIEVRPIDSVVSSYRSDEISIYIETQFPHERFDNSIKERVLDFKESRRKFGGAVGIYYRYRLHKESDLVGSGEKNRPFVRKVIFECDDASNLYDANIEMFVKGENVEATVDMIFNSLKFSCENEKGRKN